MVVASTTGGRVKGAILSLIVMLRAGAGNTGGSGTGASGASWIASGAEIGEGECSRETADAGGSVTALGPAPPSCQKRTHETNYRTWGRGKHARFNGGERAGLILNFIGATRLTGATAATGDSIKPFEHPASVYFTRLEAGSVSEPSMRTIDNYK